MSSHTHSSDEYEYLILPILLLLSIFFTFLLLHFLLRRGTHRRLPPGRQGFPLVGETLQLIWAYKTENPEPFIDERVGRFGSVFTTHVFGEGTIFSADPEVNRLILQSEGKFVDVSYPGSISNLLGKHSLLLMKGSLHKRMHSLTINFSSSPPMLKDHLLFDIDRLVRSNLDSWSDHVLLMEQAKKITFELAMKQLLSLDPCEWTERLRREYVLVIEGFFTLPFPLFSTTYRRAIQARAKVAEALRLVVRERRKVVEAEESSEDEKSTTKKKKNDILGALLGAADEDLSSEEIVDFLVGMLVAGYETTSTSMTLAVKFLTDNPTALAHLREEHDDIRRRKGEAAEALDWTDYKSSMPFTQCVVNETLRVGNIISGVFRRAITDIPLKGGYTIPKGWKVFASFRAVHMHPIHFKDARTFNPWRWHHRHQDNNSAGRGNVFTPFGGGGRLCPGYELARLQLSVFLHHLVTRFSWEPAEKDKLVFFPTTRTQKQYPINVTRRNQV